MDCIDDGIVVMEIKWIQHAGKGAVWNVEDRSDDNDFEDNDGMD